MTTSIVTPPTGLSKCKGPPVSPPSTCYNFKHMIKITVKDGPTQKEYLVFRGLLVWHSSYFAAALDPKSSFIESRSQSCELEESIDVFEVFYCWLYTSRLRDPHQGGKMPTVSDIYLNPNILCKIWVFADFRGIPALGNAAIDMLHERTSAMWIAPTDSIPYVYENTVEGSLLRKFLNDMCINILDVNSIRKTKKSDLTVDFLVEILPQLIERGKDQTSSRAVWEKFDRCAWHDHSGPAGKTRVESRK